MLIVRVTAGVRAREADRDRVAVATRLPDRQEVNLVRGAPCDGTSPPVRPSDGEELEGAERLGGGRDQTRELGRANLAYPLCTREHHHPTLSRGQTACKS